jgi:uncharacterized protein (TIGR00730 family)
MRICVYTGSRHGSRPEYRDTAEAFGRLLAREGIGLVYGGGRLGLMGVVADAALAAGGEAIGTLPQKLVALEVAHRGLSELHVVDSMHERKALMADLSDGFVALPGGIGTLEELFEVWAWLHLGYHDKPCGLLNVSGFYDPLITFLDKVVEEGFLRADTRAMLFCEENGERLLAAMRSAPHRERYSVLDREEL